MKRIVFTVVFCVASSSAVWADTSLQSQLESVAQAEASGKAAEQKKIDDAKLEAEKEERAWKQRRAAEVNAANKKASDRAAAVAAQNANPQRLMS